MPSRTSVILNSSVGNTLCWYSPVHNFYIALLAFRSTVFLPPLKYFLSSLNSIFFLVKRKENNHAWHSFCQSDLTVRVTKPHLQCSSITRFSPYEALQDSTTWTSIKDFWGSPYKKKLQKTPEKSNNTHGPAHVCQHHNGPWRRHAEQPTTHT
jgi:hypothetical protein